MTARSIGIVDYGMGNHASVAHCLRDLGFRVKISKETAELDEVDALVLPGVGAFPSAMHALHVCGLVGYLQEQARLQRPTLGICLGMQLLTSASHEHEYTAGLNLIPGEIEAFPEGGWHIGWNTLECTQPEGVFMPSDGHTFYFNHSFHYRGPADYQYAIARHPAAFAAIIKRGSVVGLQFHPEKSQAAGRTLLLNLLEGLIDA